MLAPRFKKKPLHKIRHVLGDRIRQQRDFFRRILIVASYGNSKRATSAESSVEPSSTTRISSTISRGIRAMAFPIFAASLKTGTTAMTDKLRYIVSAPYLNNRRNSNCSDNEHETMSESTGRFKPTGGGVHSVISLPTLKHSMIMIDLTGRFCHS